MTFREMRNRTEPARIRRESRRDAPSRSPQPSAPFPDAAWRRRSARSYVSWWLFLERGRPLAAQPPSDRPLWSHCPSESSRLPCRARAGPAFVAVKERALLGEYQSGAIALGLELRCGDGDRDADPVQEHVVGVDDASGPGRCPGRAPGRCVPGPPAASLGGAPIRRRRSRARISPPNRRTGGPWPAGRTRRRILGRGGVVDALPDKCGVLYGSFAHRVPAFGGSSSLSAR
jgi:hypothetical protein